LNLIGFRSCSTPYFKVTFLNLTSITQLRTENNIKRKTWYNFHQIRSNSFKVLCQWQNSEQEYTPRFNTGSFSIYETRYFS